MMNHSDLRDILRRIDHRGYPAYKDTRGKYDFGKYVLSIDHVQGDPFAAPSRLSVHIDGKTAGFPVELFDTDWRRVALEDLLLREFGKKVSEGSFQAHGSGKSGLIGVSRPGQEVLKRSACLMDEKTGSLVVRFQVGFPARGRTVLSDELVKILYDILPKCVEKSLFATAYRTEFLKKNADLADDRHFIREELKERNLVAFIADGSILPRKSGISQLPMKEAVVFKAPDSLAVTLSLPHKGELRGMGIKKGITLIVGGGYHGKSTLLSAIERGVYDHIAGDGREYVITDENSVKLRAEDGRSIQNTDISMFIRNLPNGKDTKHFYTEDASGSTSQAANTVEALEAGAKCLLIDEDTSATNFMIRDELMQRVVAREEEPIIPYIDRVEELSDRLGVSTILVAGSSGSYFHKADYIIQMKQYLPYDITERAKEEAEVFPLKGGQALDAAAFSTERVVTKGEAKGKRSAHGGREEHRGNAHGRGTYGKPADREERIKTKTFGTDGFSINKEQVELRFVEQLIDSEQVDALAQILIFMSKNIFDGKKTVSECVDALYREIGKKGFAAFDGDTSDHLVIPRKFEVYEMLNRCREFIKIQ